MGAPKDSLRSLDPRRLGDLFTRAEPERPRDTGDGGQTLSPWAIAVSVLALLGFGTLVGTSLGSPAGTRTVLLSAAPASHSSATSTSPSAATPPPITPEAPPAASSSGGGEAEEESGKENEEEKPKKQSAGTKKTEKAATPGAPTKSGSGENPASGLPPIDHVFLIVLSELGYSSTFGAGPSAPYLSKTLPGEGELIESYYAVAGGEPANGIALISGQGPTEQTLQGCQLYSDVVPASAGPNGQTLGAGCVYPSTTLTLANQLETAGKTWKAYVEGVGTSGGGTATGCPHPQLGASDPTSATAGTGGYESRRNPFVYFHSLIDGSACAKNDVGIGQLASDLAGAGATPSFAYIAPGACDDGSSRPCSPGAPAGVGPAEAFLRKVVGVIEKSDAYKQGGLIAITSDQAPQGGSNADTSGCCVSAPYPNLPASALPAPSTGAGSQVATGGGKVGLLLISKYVKAGSLNMLGEYDHFSLLLSIESLFGLKPLGYAGAKGLLAFDPSVYNGHP